MGTRTLGLHPSLSLVSRTPEKKIITSAILNEIIFHYFASYTWTVVIILIQALYNTILNIHIYLLICSCICTLSHASCTCVRISTPRNLLTYTPPNCLTPPHCKKNSVSGDSHMSNENKSVGWVI